MQTLTQTFSWISKAAQAKNLTVSDKAAAIFEDAVDTANNLAKAGDLLGSIYEVLVYYANNNRTGSLDGDLIHAVIDKLGTNHEVVLFDFVDDDTATGIHLAYVQNYQIVEHEEIDVIGYYSQSRLIPIFYSTAGADLWFVYDDTAISTFDNGDIDVKIHDVCGNLGSYKTVASNLADAFGVATLVSTVTNSLSTGAGSLSSVCATVSTSVKALGPTAREMWSDILQNCGQDPESLLNYLMELYTGFTTAGYSTSTDETKQQGYIAMDHDTTHFIKSFSSTAVWQVVSTGLQYAGMVLMVAGGAALKVIGGVITAATTIINKVTEVGSNLDTTAKVNIKAPNADFNVPIWWKSWTSAPFSSVALQAKIDDVRTLVLHVPMLDVYMWYNDDNAGNRTYEAQAYIRPEKDAQYIPTQKYNDNVLSLITPMEDAGHNRYYRAAKACSHASHISVNSGFSLAVVDDVPLSDDYTMGWNLLSDDHAVGRTQVALMSDTALSNTIAYDLVLIAIMAIADTNTVYDYYPSIVASQLQWSTNDLGVNIANVLHGVNTTGLLSQVDWTAIVNYLIPSLQSYSGVDIINKYIMKFEYSEYSTTEDYPDFFLVNANWVLIQDGYFLIEHPNYTKNAIMLITLASIAILAVGVIAVVVVKKTISKTISRKMLQKRIALSKQRDALNPSDYASVKAYDKATRRYNFLARITGYPTVDVFNDWVNDPGDESKPNSSSDDVMENFLNQIKTLITG